MDPNYKFPASPGTGSPLHQMSPERANQQRFDTKPVQPLHGYSASHDASRNLRESSVSEKAAKFESLAFQGKQLERRTNDAALKRAMLGREEAESEMRRYREEARQLKKQMEEGRDRERKVGERLESVMENYGRAKETHAHTQALWEKEIRRARKESFKSQSVVVKLQEELQSTRRVLRKAQSDVDDEKERSNKREQEAFAARYQLVGLQEELATMQEKIKLVEQERDALRTIAKNEEVVRIAAEGQLPLPSSSPDDEFASPRKASAPLRVVSVTSSKSSEDEIQQLKQALEWEQQRAERAYDQIDFMQIECQFNCCSCKISGHGGPTIKHSSPKLTKSRSIALNESSRGDASSFMDEPFADAVESFEAPKPQPQAIFVPSEGIFRTVVPAPVEESPWISPAKQLQPVEKSSIPYRGSIHGRTPSCEPPANLLSQSQEANANANSSLMSLLNGPPSPAESTATVVRHPQPQYEEKSEEETEPERKHEPETQLFTRHQHSMKDSASSSHSRNPIFNHHPHQTNIPIHGAPRRSHREESQPQHDATPQYEPESETSADPTPIFHTISTTTRIPLADPSDSTPTTTQPAAILPASLDPALSPTMTREEALAMIRERRGRARSLANGTLTPRKQMVEGTGKRDISAPSVRSVSRGRLNGANRA